MAKVKKAVWLSYDLGIGGDFPGLYKWLDNHEAVECGNSIAFFFYSIDKAKTSNLVDVLEDELKKAINLRAGDRLYIIRREEQGSKVNVKGTFICGKRKSNPWEGYGDNDSISEEGGE